jgi:RNA polymerase sigma-70 factor, ECF subfamily
MGSQAAGGMDDAHDFDAVFHNHYGPMVRALGLASGDREAAADAVQDAFIRAYARWRRISRYDDPAGWVRHVAMNRLRDHFRRVERGTRVLQRLGTESRADTDGSAPQPPESDGGLTAAIATLPRQQRIALSLFYVEQLTVNEVANAMRLSEGAVKYHLHAGRAALRVQAERA